MRDDGRSTDSIPEYMNDELPMVVSPSWSFMDFRDVHSLKMVSGSFFNPEGSRMSVRLMQPLKMPVPRFVADSGIMMLFRDEAFLKQSYWMLVRLSGRDTDVSPLLPENTLYASVRTPSGIFA